MKVLTQFSALAQERLKNVVMTLGTFDGVHQGHQKLIEQVVARAKKKRAPSLVLSYARHPSRVLAKNSAKWVPLLTTVEKKISLLEKMGVDYLLFLPFNRRFAQIPPRKFFEEKVCGAVGLSEVWIGKDTTFGKGGKGDPLFLKKLGQELGFKVFTFPNVMVKGEVVHSTKIRRLIQEGDLGKANAFLGRPYSIEAKVVRGDQIGQKIGFPTANLQTKNESLPGRGVYAVLAKWGKKEWIGGLNIGFRPTLHLKRKELRIEAHFIGLKQKIYGKKLEVFFFHKLRDEKRFSGLPELKKQIQKDLEAAQKFFNKL
jgi:riboflavin kinase/FMN adenylyltransferase